MGQQYTYQYVLDSDGEEIIAHVSYAFDDISDLESISRFPHRERREFALSLMTKYEADKYHTIDPNNIVCPFAVQLQILFEDSFMVYWTRKFRTTLLFYRACLNYFEYLV